MRAVDATKRFEATPARAGAGPLHRRGGGALHALPLRPRLEDARRAGAARAGGRGLGRPWADNHMPGPVFAPNLTPGSRDRPRRDPRRRRGARHPRGGEPRRARAVHDAVAELPRPLRRGRRVGGRLPAHAAAGEEGARDDGDRRARALVPEADGRAADRAGGREPRHGSGRARQAAGGGRPVRQTCHTPVDARHQPLPGMAFAGGQAFTIGGVRYLSANITPDPSGISHYNEELFIRTMRTGNVGGRRLAPIMPWSEIRKLTDDDLKALWAYLKTVTPVAHDVERTPVDLKDNPAIDDRTGHELPVRNERPTTTRRRRHHENPSRHRPRPRSGARRARPRRDSRRAGRSAPTPAGHAARLRGRRRRHRHRGLARGRARQAGRSRPAHARTCRCPRTGPITPTSAATPATPSASWRCSRAKAGRRRRSATARPAPGFSLVRGAIENHAAIEIVRRATCARSTSSSSRRSLADRAHDTGEAAYSRGP